MSRHPTIICNKNPGADLVGYRGKATLHAILLHTARRCASR